jgi:hypothetical protein
MKLSARERTSLQQIADALQGGASLLWEAVDAEAKGKLTRVQLEAAISQGLRFGDAAICAAQQLRGYANLRGVLKGPTHAD